MPYRNQHALQVCCLQEHQITLRWAMRHPGYQERKILTYQDIWQTFLPYGLCEVRQYSHLRAAKSSQKTVQRSFVGKGALVCL